MNRFLAFAACLTLPILFVPAAFADDAADCAAMTEVVGGTNQGAPYMVDSVTRSEVATQDCATKSANFNWTILTTAAELASNWHEIIRGNFQNGYCNEPGLAAMAKAGWTITATWTTQDGEVYSTPIVCP